jgi:hypothetical protein
LKYRYLFPLLFLSGCSSWHVQSWFHRKPIPPDPTQLVVTGAPAGASLIIDGAPVNADSSLPGKPMLVDVAPGRHTVEVKVREKITYREDLYVAPGEKHPMAVLSGSRGD